LRDCVINRKVAVSVPDGVIGIFYWYNPSGRTMALGVTQSLRQMGKGKGKVIPPTTGLVAFGDSGRLRLQNF
jgi:hypothetical protein